MKRPHHPRMTRCRVRLLAGLAAGVLLAAACGDDGNGSDDDASGDAAATAEQVAAEAMGDNVIPGPHHAESEPVTGGSITVGIESETNTYLPSSFQASQAGFNVALAIYDPLVARNADGELEPYLAESVESNDDFTEWTVTLRPDVVFHDGTPLDADALKANFDDYLTVDGALTQGALRDVERMEVVDDLTVRYVLSQPDSAFDDNLSVAPGYPFSPTAADDLGDAFGENPVGTGPFRFVSWQRDGDLVVERNPDYWQEGMPYLDEITFRPIPDEETRAASLASRDIDVAQSVRLSSFLARVRDIPGVEIALGFWNGSGNVMFNTTEPPVDDVRVRQALAYAVDQQAIIEVVAGEAAAASELRTQYFSADSPYYSEAVAEAWPGYDPDRAQELYDEYVNDPNRSDGKAVGSPVSLTYKATNIPSLRDMATAFQGFWEEIGFDVEVDPLEQSVLITDALTGNYQAMNFRLGSDQDPLTMLEAAFGDPEERITNFTNYNNATVEQTIEILRATADVEERAAAVEDLGLLLAEDLPVYWTGNDLPFFAYDESIEGIASWVYPHGSLGNGARPAVTLWGQVWVED